MTSNHSWTSKSGGALVIAEAGVNHNGDVELALRLVDAAADIGADAVKFQTFNADALATADADKAAYQESNAPDAASQLEMLRALELTEAEFTAVRDRCVARGIQFMSTPFDESSADFLERLDVDIFKVSSGDLTHLSFLAHLARKKRPMIISTGMATLSEVEDAVRAIEAAGDPPLAILHCVSNYPAAPEHANLRAMDTLASAFNRTVGWSDHTEGSSITLAAIARGAGIIEKHYTLDRSLPGPDHKASLEVEEMRNLIRDIRAVEAALGDGVKRPTPPELDTARVARRSLVAARDITKGETVDAAAIAVMRPGDGLPPKRQGDIEGRRAARDIRVGERFAWGMLDS